MYICIGSHEKYTAYLACNVYLYWISWKIQHLVVDHEIRQISWWNLVDFMPNEPRTYKYTAYLACNVYLYWISWKIQHLVVDHEIWWISWIKFSGFHGWSWKMQTWKCKIFMMLITFLYINQISDSLAIR